MTKTEFLQQLYNHLQPLSPKERDEIIQDFEEHFSIGFENGKTEEQICTELGNPYTCALQYLRQPAQPVTPKTAPVQPSERPYGQQTSNQTYINRNRFLWGLLFFFFVLCAFGVYPTAIGLMASPIAVIIAAVFVIAAVPSGLMIAFMVSLSIALFAAGLLTFLIMTWLLKLCYKKSGL